MDAKSEIPSDYEVKELGKKNQLYLPDKYVKDKDVDIKEGDKVAVFKQGRHIVIAKIENPGLRLALLGSIMAVMMICSAVVLPLAAYAQAQEVSQATGGGDPPLSAPLGGSDVISVGVEQTVTTISFQTIELKAMTAYLPFRLELTYPSGASKIENVTHISPSGGYATRTIVGFPAPGMSVTEFTTAAVDNYNIQLGQVYNRDIDSIVNVAAYSNGSMVYGEQIPIKGNRFVINFAISTSFPPRLPTAQDLNSLNEVYFQRIEAKIDSQTTHIQSQSTAIDSIASTAITTYAFLAIAAISIAIIAITMYFNRNRYEPKYGAGENSRGSSSGAVSAEYGNGSGAAPVAAGASQKR